MTTQDKAKELYKKYLIIIVDDIIDMKIIYGTLTHKLAKQCALIAVDEILNMLIGSPDFINYWQEVKTEIQKL